MGTSLRSDYKFLQSTMMFCLLTILASTLTCASAIEVGDAVVIDCGQCGSGSRYVWRVADDAGDNWELTGAPGYRYSPKTVPKTATGGYRSLKKWLEPRDIGREVVFH